MVNGTRLTFDGQKTPAGVAKWVDESLIPYMETIIFSKVDGFAERLEALEANREAVAAISERLTALESASTGSNPKALDLEPIRKLVANYGRQVEARLAEQAGRVDTVYDSVGSLTQQLAALKATPPLPITQSDMELLAQRVADRITADDKIGLEEYFRRVRAVEQQLTFPLADSQVQDLKVRLSEPMAMAISAEVERQLNPLLDRMTSILENLDLLSSQLSQPNSDEEIVNEVDDETDREMEEAKQTLKKSLLALEADADKYQIASLISKSPVLNELGLALLEEDDITIGEFTRRAVEELLSPKVETQSTIKSMLTAIRSWLDTH